MQGKIILIIDDDVFIRETYADVFRGAGYTVLEAGDGVEGLDLATTKNPDVIFTGIVMPRMDGFMLMESLKKNTATSVIPVFISSHLGREDDKKRANELGAKGFIVRDFTSPAEVVETISAVFAEGGEYMIEFDPFNLDAQRMAKDLSMHNNFQCMECNERLILKLRAGHNSEHKASFVCPRCGWRQR